MIKEFKQAHKIGLALSLLVVALAFFLPQLAHAGWKEDLVAFIPGVIAAFILQIVSFITYMSGIILNYVVEHTVVNMAENIERGGVVTDAWRTIRDLANMSFIFILLYASIQLILGIGRDTQRLIVNVVMVAILINFSLFATKLVIDASNIIAITFYGAMAPEALNEGHSILERGLSNSLMEPLKIQSLWKIRGESLEGMNLLIIGIMGSIFALVAAFVFFAVSIMLIIRFVVLIFALILSPLAFASTILPATKKHFDNWWNALSSQAFFAPLYFMLTWIVVKLSQGIFTTEGSIAGALSTSIQTGDGGGTSAVANVDNIGLVVNFIVVIAFLIASLIIAKNMADKAGPGVKGLTKWATGVAGGATLGLAGRAGRVTVGRAGQTIADSKFIKERAPESRTWRLAQAASLKAGKASFDTRSTGLGKTLNAGKAIGKGGYVKQEEEKLKRRTDEAKRYEEKVSYKDVEKLAQEKASESRAERDVKIKSAQELKASDPTSRINNDAAEKQIEEANKKYQTDFETHREAAEKEAGVEAKKTTKERKERFAANLSKTGWLTPNLYSGVKTDREAARKIRAGMKEKTKEEKAKDSALEYLKEIADKEAKEKESQSQDLNESSDEKKEE